MPRKSLQRFCETAWMKQRPMHVAQKCAAVLRNGMDENKDLCMSRKSAQRFCENDMHENKDLKRVAWIRFSAMRFSRRRLWPLQPQNACRCVLSAAHADRDRRP
ncbi:MAG: hypothetical protein EOS77_10910 [Mesorhizobium sp.]|nr:MAG: hypothetical protein EOS77_10910 [Mesorhizobium sp.]